MNEHKGIVDENDRLYNVLSDEKNTVEKAKIKLEKELRTQITSYEKLETKHNILKDEKNDLEIRYNSLQRESDETIIELRNNIRTL